MNPILVWEWKDAPQELRALSEHGGDEDWVAEVPPAVDEWHPALRRLLASVICDVSKHDHPTKEGWKVYIAAHA